jgi:hypothetical protein
MPLRRGMIMRQMTGNQASLGEPKEAARRGRDLLTLSSLVRSLERLNTLDTSRQARDRKKPRNAVERKDGFVRRWDQHLTNEAAANLARMPDGG